MGEVGLGMGSLTVTYWENGKMLFFLIEVNFNFAVRGFYLSGRSGNFYLKMGHYFIYSNMIFKIHFLYFILTYYYFLSWGLGVEILYHKLHRCVANWRCKISIFFGLFIFCWSRFKPSQQWHLHPLIHLQVKNGNFILLGFEFSTAFSINKAQFQAQNWGGL